MEEIWKDIDGYEGKYQVSNFGNVKSLNYHRSGEERPLATCVDNNGYLYVTLRKNGKKEEPKIHRLVANAFILDKTNFKYVGEEDRLKYIDSLDKLVVNHIIEGDEGKKNNRVDNLEWCTVKYNNMYGTHSKRVAKAKSKKLLQLNLDGTFVKKWESATEVQRRTNYLANHICDCCNGKRKQAYGFKWCYVD